MDKFNRFDHKPRDVRSIELVCQAHEQWDWDSANGGWNFHQRTHLTMTDVICIRYTDGAQEYLKGAIIN